MDKKTSKKAEKFLNSRPTHSTHPKIETNYVGFLAINGMPDNDILKLLYDFSCSSN